MQSSEGHDSGSGHTAAAGRPWGHKERWREDYPPRFSRQRGLPPGRARPRKNKDEETRRDESDSAGDNQNRPRGLTGGGT